MHGINGMNWGMGYTWIFIVVIVAGAIWYISRMNQTTRRNQQEKTAMEILNERYASGEINKEEYDQLKSDIR